MTRTRSRPDADSMTRGTRWLIVLLVATSAAAAAAAACAAAGTMAQVLFRIPGTDYDLMLGGPARAPTVGPESALVHAIALWLAQEFELSSIQRYPAIKIVSSDAMISLRYRGLLPTNARVEGASNGEAPPASDILAIYSDRDETIYLAEGWNSGTAAGVSVLVHEMVHHLQRVLGLRHECPQERETLAYQAQERWLGLFGHSLEKDFRLDGFSLLVKTRCF
jgi:uncharacterized protein DUF6647